MLGSLRFSSIILVFVFSRFRVVVLFVVCMVV